MTDAVAKQAALVKSIADATKEGLMPSINDLTKMVATLSVTNASIEARLQVLEATAVGGAKRATKATATAGGAKKAGAAAKKADDPTAKVKNSMLYFRFMWMNDEEFRGEWGPALSEDLDGLFEAEASVTKKAAGSAERLSAEGNYLWKNVLSDDQKKHVKAAFDEWQKAIVRAAEEGQLEQDE